jgi:hypothetical protein
MWHKYNKYFRYAPNSANNSINIRRGHGIILLDSCLICGIIILDFQDNYINQAVYYINERGILLIIENVRRDSKSCAKRLNRALRDIEKAMDERPDVQRFDRSDREIGRWRIERRAQKVGYTDFRLLREEEIC